MRNLRYVLVVAGLFASAPARADAPPDRTTASVAADPPDAGPDAAPPALADVLVGPAREDYFAARQLYGDGEFARALARFKAAYNASQDPRLLWNAAVCEKAMGHYAAAIALVQRYLEAGAPRVTPEAEHEARAFVTAAATRTGRLDVVSSEGEARVYVDGVAVAQTPLRPAHVVSVVDEGLHQVALEKSGFAPFATQVAVRAESEATVVAVLVRVDPHGRVAVHAGPGDAIAIDGRVVAGGTWEGELSADTHSVRVTASGKRTFRTDLLVGEGETRELDVRLEPSAAGSLPAWAWIVGGTVLAAGATTAAYFLFRTGGEPATPAQGTIATVHSP